MDYPFDSKETQTYPRQCDLPWRYRMTLCAAAVCHERKKPRIVIGTDWKVGIEIATAEIQDKLYWIDDNMPVLIAGEVSRAVELKDTFKQHFEHIKKQDPNFQLRPPYIFDIIKKPVFLFKEKLANELVSLKYGLSYGAFRGAVSKGEIPQAEASQILFEISQINLGCSLLILAFEDGGYGKNGLIYVVAQDGKVHRYENFAAIGSGGTIAESSLYLRQHESKMSLERTIYHVYEAMKLGSIASDVGEEHTITVLYPPGEKAVMVSGYNMKEKTYQLLEGRFKKFGPSKIAQVSLPNDPFERDF